MDRSWMEVMECHREQEALFARHQEALLRLRLDEAVETMSEYSSLLEVHMQMEETVVLPLYAERGGPRPGGDVDLFLFEHTKLRRQLKALTEVLATLREVPELELAAAVIAVLDQECAYKNLMAHHDTRERNMLYPRLDELTSIEERTEWVARCVG